MTDREDQTSDAIETARSRPDQEEHPSAGSGDAAERRTRRRLIKAGAALIPTLITLRARPVWASHGNQCQAENAKDPACTAYGTSQHN